MASTAEMFLAGMALLINTLLLLVFYFVFNTVLGPIYNFAGQFFAQNTPVAVNMAEISYIPSAIFGLLLATEVVFIIAFVAVLGRREYVGDYYD